MELDPYKVLKVPYDADLVLIRSQFKKAVLKHHPDRGGNPKAFQIIKSAYSYLYKYKTNEAKQLANEQRTLKQAQQERQNQTKELKQGFQQIQNNPYVKKLNPNNMDSKLFNRMFNDFQAEGPEDADARGYETIKSSKVRLDAGDLQKKYGKQQKKQMQIAIIEEPEPMELGTGNYKQLGLDHVDNFSKRHAGRGQGFTDLQQAYTNQQNMETMGNSRVESRLGKVNSQMSRLQQDRANVSYKMNDKDIVLNEMKKQQEQAMEEQRRFRFNQQTEQSQKQFQRMQNYITFR